MKKSAIILMLLILAFTLTGCSKDVPKTNEQNVPNTDIDSDIKEFEDLDEELDISDFDELEKDLNIEI